MSGRFFMRVAFRFPADIAQVREGMAKIAA
jgi:hypothetical protein